MDDIIAPVVEMVLELIRGIYPTSTIQRLSLVKPYLILAHIGGTVSFHVWFEDNIISIEELHMFDDGIPKDEYTYEVSLNNPDFMYQIETILRGDGSPTTINGQPVNKDDIWGDEF